jgi:thermitase
MGRSRRSNTGWVVRGFLICLLIATAWFASPLAPAAGPLPQASSPDPGSRFVPGEILIKLESGVTQPRVAAQALSAPELATAEAVPDLGLLKLKVTTGDELRQTERFLARPGVAYAEPNYIVRALETPNDPGFGNQWGLSMIDAPGAWDVTHGSSSVIIAIVDSGIDGTHPDLSGKVLAGWNFVSSGAIPANRNSDDYGHGTHVAGIAAAITNNGVGVAGLAWNSRLMPVKVLDSGGSGTDANVALGIHYAADHGAQVINLSLGGPDASYTMHEAVDYALAHGCLLPTAAGNSGGLQNLPEYGILYPAQYAMAIGATDFSDRRASFSKYGPQMSVAAPGVGIYSTWTGGSYAYESGTSMAAPHVSGLAALLWGICPADSNAHVRQVIEDTAVDLGTTGWDEKYGYGRIDAQKAVQTYFSFSSQSSPLVFLADDTTTPRPQDAQLIRCGASGVITWSASISPTVTWLSVSPLTGTVSGAQPIVLQVQADPTGLGHGLYHCNVIIDGDAGTFLAKSIEILPVSLSYSTELYRQRFPLLYKSYRY